MFHVKVLFKNFNINDQLKNCAVSLNQSNLGFNTENVDSILDMPGLSKKITTTKCNFIMEQ
jgi:hypothetical protein